MRTRPWQFVVPWYRLPMLQLRDMEMWRDVVSLHVPCMPRYTFVSTKNHREDCAPGTCWEGACTGFPSQYSMDGKCGPLANGLLCGGKWGDCCSRQGQCGAGDDFCSFDKCYSGNCIIPQPEWKAPWQVGDTPDGTCGDPNGYTCDVTFGNCCGFNGKCGSRVEHCGLGW